MNCNNKVLDKLFYVPQKGNLLCDCFSGWRDVSDAAVMEAEEKLTELELQWAVSWQGSPIYRVIRTAVLADKIVCVQGLAQRSLS